MAEELTTPGPWVVGERHGGRWIAIHPSGVPFRLVADVNADRIHGEADARLIAASKDLLALARIIGAAYPNDPGTSDLDDEQPVTITLGTVRRAWAALAKVDR